MSCTWVWSWAQYVEVDQRSQEECWDISSGSVWHGSVGFEFLKSGLFVDFSTFIYLRCLVATNTLEMIQAPVVRMCVCTFSIPVCSFPSPPAWPGDSLGISVITARSAPFLFRALGSLQCLLFPLRKFSLSFSTYAGQRERVRRAIAHCSTLMHFIVLPICL